MADVARNAEIHAVIARARRRLRLQAAAEAATLASVAAVAVAAAMVYLYRTHTIVGGAAVAGLIGAALMIVAGGAIGWMRRVPDAVAAQRVDRACGLADRLGTAADFERRLRSDEPIDPQTRELMQAAIDDATRLAARADARAGTPFVSPRELPAAAAFGAVAAVILLLGFPERDPVCLTCLVPEHLASTRPDTLPPGQQPVSLDDDDIAYSRDLLDDLRRTADETDDPHLREFVDNVDALLAKAERGEITKEQLLEQLAAHEKAYMKGADDDVEETMDDLRDTGRELKKHDLTRELGEALEKGDLDKAREEFDKLADKLENGELDPKETEQVAKALDRAADQFERKDKERDERAGKDLEKKRDEVRRLEKQRDEEKDPERKAELERRLDRKKRELERLERKEEAREKSASRRRLKQLHRNMKKAAENMRDQSGNEEERNERRREASRRMRDAGDDTGKVDGDRKRVNNQRKVATQVGDLRDALRRAKSGKGNGGSKFGKNQRNQDFGRRAAGGKGSREAWRPGSGREGRMGRNPGAGDPGGNGTQPGGSSWGTEDGGDPLGGAGLRGNEPVKDEAITGVHGKRGSSTRETILSAAQKGFASRSYESVYTSYKTIIEEVMRTEKVPSGYKYYIKRYFQKIKPHSMD